MTPQDKVFRDLMGAKPGCSDTLLGRELTATLGKRPQQPALRMHLASCFACQLERRAFAAFRRGAATPSRALIERLRGAARRR
jgi:hypothetical protein